MIGLLNALGVSLYWTTASIHAEMRVSNAIARVREGLRRQREQRKDEAFTRALKADASARYDTQFLPFIIVWSVVCGWCSLGLLLWAVIAHNGLTEIAVLAVGLVSNAWCYVVFSRDYHKAKTAREALKIEAAMDRMAKDYR